VYNRVLTRSGTFPGEEDTRSKGSRSLIAVSAEVLGSSLLDSLLKADGRGVPPVAPN